MEKSKSPALMAQSLAPEVLDQMERDLLSKATGTKVEMLQLSMVQQFGYILPPSTPQDLEARGEALATMAFALSGFAPRDELEGHLCMQMIAASNTAMECLRRANHPNNTHQGREQDLKHFEKLSTLYARHMEALDRHRGKGQQKITVEHVNVHAGGQAIVGNVGSDAARMVEGATTPAIASQSPVVSEPITAAAQQTKRATAKKSRTKRG